MFDYEQKHGPRAACSCEFQSVGPSRPQRASVPPAAARCAVVGPGPQGVRREKRLSGWFPLVLLGGSGMRGGVADCTGGACVTVNRAGLHGCTTRYPIGSLGVDFLQAIQYIPMDL
jgi:hypothetical protein